MDQIISVNIENPFYFYNDVILYHPRGVPITLATWSEILYRIADHSMNLQAKAPKALVLTSALCDVQVYSYSNAKHRDLVFQVFPTLLSPKTSYM